MDETLDQVETPKEQPPLEVNYKYNPAYHRLSDYVGVDRHERDNSETVKKMSFIYDWAGKRTEAKDVSGVISHQTGSWSRFNVGSKIFNK